MQRYVGTRREGSNERVRVVLGFKAHSDGPLDAISSADDSAWAIVAPRVLARLKPFSHEQELHSRIDLKTNISKVSSPALVCPPLALAPRIG